MSEEKSITDLPKHRLQFAATADGRVVPETDPEARFVLGSQVDEATAKQYGVTLKAIERAREDERRRRRDAGEPDEPPEPEVEPAPSPETPPPPEPAPVEPPAEPPPEDKAVESAPANKAAKSAR